MTDHPGQSDSSSGNKTACIDGIAVIIVNYNAGDYLLRCMRSLFDQIQPPAATVIVDNDSSDDSFENAKTEFAEAENIRWLANTSNTGFASACNQGLAEVDQPYVLFLNPDCELSPDVLEHMQSVLDSDPRIGLAGCLITDTQGREQRATRRRFPTPRRSFFSYSGLSRLAAYWPGAAGVDMRDQPLPESVTDMDAVSGAFMFCRRDVLVDIGGFDTGYRLHCEDLDLCRRVLDAGYRVVFTPGASVIHHQGVSSRSRPVWVSWQKHRGMLRFFNKFYAATTSPLSALPIKASIWGHFLVTLPLTWLRSRLG